MEEFITNNKVKITGEIAGGFTFSHEFYGEKFYMMNVRCKRLNENCDTIPVMVSERLMDVKKDFTGKLVYINGQFRSYNRCDGQKSRLILSVFAREIKFIEEIADLTESDSIFLGGYICKEPVYRKTPLGREITDVLLAVNRPYGKSDYIPCIFWGRNAKFASGFKIGEHISVWGRIQSREYTKKLEDGRFEVRTAYEVSVSKMEVADGQEQG